MGLLLLALVAALLLPQFREPVADMKCRMRPPGVFGESKVSRGGATDAGLIGDDKMSLSPPQIERI